MTDLNAVHITGRLVKDIELRSTATGSRFAWFQLAVNGRKDKIGNQQTDYLPCQLWGKPAELLGVYGKKGTRIMITNGSVKTFTKEDPNTNIRQTYTYIAVSGFEFVDGFKGTGQKQSEDSVFDAMGENVEVNF